MYTKKSFLIAIIFFLFCNNSYSKEGMPQFNVESFPSQIFWLFISFGFLYMFVTFVILPRIRENIRLRKNKISNDIEIATATRNQTLKMIDEYNKKINDAKNKAKNIIKNSAKKTQEDFNNQIETVKNQIESKILNTEQKIKEQKQEIEKNIEETSENISKLIIEKILRN